MTDILIVAATPMESVVPSGKHGTFITGPGIAATTYQLTKALQQQKYRFVVNIGICGTLDYDLPAGTLVHVTSDRFADFGAEDGDIFLPAQQLGLIDPGQFPFTDGKLIPEPSLLPNAIPDTVQREGITVQKVHGSERSVQAAKHQFGPCVESMEGAAFFYVCMMENVPCIQLRAVSNRVERRNREAWDIPAALETLSSRVPSILEMIL